ncbi:hypothetical protein [Fibrella forsythiae]|uniref:Uncharacterized protein n=1 Tax=Fibrella forsythiae TaxID=2817061 RepID=A0ABS3JP73_9BACT|nr:hypothetical protein [Fibrella forsythiae]MBO0951804.1 hypothetical protein [Fibrella forsythiae]
MIDAKTNKKLGRMAKNGTTFGVRDNTLRYVPGGPDTELEPGAEYAALD